jgi:capsular polysaccharide transport system permease protein
MNGELNLRRAFNRPQVDFFSRLWWGNSKEDLLAYYRNKVSIVFDGATNISTLTTFAFSPADARRMNEILLRLSESIINKLNERANQDAIDLAREEVNRAEDRVREERLAMTRFRKGEGSIDPEKESLVVVQIIDQLETELATTRAQIAEIEALSQKDNPRLLGLNNRVQALESQIGKERARLTGSSSDAYADQIERYEALKTDDQFASARLVAAIESLELARVGAMRQNLYLIRVVEPKLADHAIYPKRIQNTAIALAVLFVLYWLSTLIWVPGVKHKI